MTMRARPSLRVYIGWDRREQEAYRVAEDSLVRSHWDTTPLQVTPLRRPQLETQGLLRRPRSRHRVTGQEWDDISAAPMSTQFAISRFLVPLLAHSGWALFVDCDVVFLGDVATLFDLADPEYALMCVKHDERDIPDKKMDGQSNRGYPRKNWSSVVLFNCDHPANLALTLDAINTKPGRWLHGFDWLYHQDLIGELPGEWNWLVGEQERPAFPRIAHFTQGGPWLPNWKGAPHDELWLDAKADAGPDRGAGDPRGGETAVPG